MFTNSSMYFICLFSLSGSGIFSAYFAAYALLLLPLSGLIIYVGFQRWRRQRSTSTVTATSHSDFVTYHILAMEILGLVGSGCYCYGVYMANEEAVMYGFFIFSMVLPGQTSFHCLTCVERYLAVVHPITYLSLKTTGVTIRIISIGCVWLMGFGWVGVAYLYLPHFPTLLCILLYTGSLLVSSFCSLSVLRTLTHPGPGEGGGHRVDQSKRRAFHTITAITVALVLRFSGILVCILLFRSMVVKAYACVLIKCPFWFSLPSSLVLPLLFLHRAGEPACFKRNTESR